MGTIAVDPVTHDRLESLKQEWGLRSYDAVIRRLLSQGGSGLPASMFGADPDLARLTRERRDEIWSKPRRGGK